MNKHEYLYKRKDGRFMFVYVDENGKHRSRSYPRILMEEKLGRPLELNEHVHHNDENPSNNDINNLDIMDIREHELFHNPKKYHDTELVCPVCGKKFLASAEKIRTYNANIRRKKLKHAEGPTCSKRCAGILSGREQAKK